MYVPLHLREWRTNDKLTAQSAFALSVQDARRTHFADAAELCSLVFEFRFKPAAGDYWYELNPSQPMLRQFCNDATIAPRGSAARLQQDPLLTDPEIVAWLPPIRWRFTKSKLGRRGQFVQVNRWPSAVISRDVLTWAWRMESEWVTYDSIRWPPDSADAASSQT